MEWEYVTMLNHLRLQGVMYVAAVCKPRMGHQTCPENTMVSQRNSKKFLYRQCITTAVTMI